MEIVRDQAATLLAKMIHDEGLEVSGLFRTWLRRKEHFWVWIKEERLNSSKKLYIWQNRTQRNNKVQAPERSLFDKDYFFEPSMPSDFCGIMFMK